MSKKAKEQLPNLVTALRIVFSTVLFFIPLKSTEFFTIYLLCGLSDVADGFLARKLHAESTFGSRLDSFADMFFCRRLCGKIYSGSRPSAMGLGWCRHRRAA